MSPTAMKRTVFQGICIMLDCLREYHPWLMLDDVKDLINRQLQGVKTGVSSVFAVVREAFSLRVRA